MSPLLQLSRLIGRAPVWASRITARRRWARWAPSALAAGVLVWSVAGWQTRVDDAADAWGSTVEVWVADGDHEPGEPMRASPTELPAALVPDASIDELVGDELARQRIGAGEVVTSFDVHRGGPLGALPDGWRAVAVRERPSSGAAIGDRVDVATEGVVLAEGAIVVDRFDDVTLVGVPARTAPLVAFADTTGVTLLRSP